MNSFAKMNVQSKYTVNSQNLNCLLLACHCDGIGYILAVS
jgi:hypothetical protein